jgi:hypothetical protein
MIFVRLIKANYKKWNENIWNRHFVQKEYTVVQQARMPVLKRVRNGGCEN